MNDKDRFINTSGRVRWNGSVLEQEMYSLRNERGEYVRYPITKWLPVPIVPECHAVESDPNCAGDVL